ncbi:hypothetical protein [Acidithiobacillus sp.]|uniref:hypothetical protein n=1 Tax=Acidithiobacillus sp. TaxID=1872118 RepID=UPI0031FE6E3E
MPALPWPNTLEELADLIELLVWIQAEHQARDTLGRVYGCFLGTFASAEPRQTENPLSH